MSGEGVQRSLDDWLGYISNQHPVTIELALDRVAEVWRRLCPSGPGGSPGFPVITVGGTNGKGSTCAMLEAILDRAGYRVGCYTSPHLLRYNERVRIARHDATDADLCRAFEAVEIARGSIGLTYFEFGTLAALWLMIDSRIDVAVLEVGLGGRLDAVNIIDADVSVVTSVGLDHMEYLGDTREKIGFEKAGIFRAGRAAVCADADAPAALVAHAASIGARLLRAGIDYDFTEQDGGQWRYRRFGGTAADSSTGSPVVPPAGDDAGARPVRRARYGLPFPALRGAYQLSNASAAITALDEIADRLPVSAEAVRTGLLTAEIAGRFQVLPGRPTVVLDVAHNPHAAAVLDASLARLQGTGRTFAVFSMLADKDIEGVVRAVKGRIDEWFIAPVDAARAADLSMLRSALTRAAALDPTTECGSVGEAWQRAQERAGESDRIVVFGSFYTVAEVLAMPGTAR
ncbi:MAG: bifunctional tetrahydrofolate synthase/dihydrofolate synthase [Burkholderiales bacterium]|nr:bifunctional tetrahydrofolate synthase/dihydrofolate synthase [Burkholderiales bacterium]